MIKQLEVSNLNNNQSYCIEFNNDLNILTGKNGSGKTTLLKLLWYLLSGKIDEAISEINFDYVKLETSNFILTIDNSSIIKYEYKDENNNWVEDEVEQWDDNISNKSLMERRAKQEIKRKKLDYISKLDKSIFFPTFRRIEGGYNSSTNLYLRRRFHEEELDEVMSRFSKNLSNENHKFITSISTNDIRQLLSEKYAYISDEINTLHSRMNQYISDEITKMGLENESAEDILKKIKDKVDEAEKEKNKRFTNFKVLSETVEYLFKDKGIKLNDSITLGDSTAKAFSSNLLSAGEKQMLSFLCYNLFFDNTSIFIDEPEISLHVDWQRMLMRILFQQKNTNQYIITTHSPFILSKYSDKEIVL